MRGQLTGDQLLSELYQHTSIKQLSIRDLMCSHTGSGASWVKILFTLTHKREAVLPLSVSVHQDPNQDACNSHQDGVVVHTLQTCNTHTHTHKFFIIVLCKIYLRFQI